MEQTQLQFLPERHIFTVGELNSAVRVLLDRTFQDIWVAGEISGCKTAASGHCYFTLRDQDAQLRCVCFRSSLRYIPFKPQDGLAVMARGRVDVYEARGEYQLLVEFIEPQGRGALQLAFEQLKKRLAAEGFFETGRKRPLPQYPTRIGIVTSPRGAVIQDMIHILGRRFPGLHIRLYPAMVQGDGSLEDVCAGLRYFSEDPWAELVILARGGGSLEDLWTFNEERLAREIAASRAPVISAVGHETDFTIADFVADLRAPTPSAAAELAICTRQELLDGLLSIQDRMAKILRYKLAEAGNRLHRSGTDRASAMLRRRLGRYAQRVDESEYRIRDLLRRRLDRERRRLTELDGRLREMDLRIRFGQYHRRMDESRYRAAQAVGLQLAHARSRWQRAAAHLQQLSPLAVLERGYAIVETAEGHIVKSAAETPPDSNIRIRLHEGRLAARVTGVFGPAIPPDSSALPSR
jgi:exodeoxyribonuclease VII large subunit